MLGRLFKPTLMQKAQFALKPNAMTYFGLRCFAGIPNKTLYIRNVSKDSTEDSLRSAFEQYGEIHSINVLNYRDDLEGKAFVEFVDIEGAKSAVEATESGLEIDGEALGVDFARGKDHPNSKAGRQLRTVFVGNVDFACEEWKLEELFESCGTVEKVSIPRNPDGTGRGFAFVQFATKEEAEASLDKAGEELDGRHLSVKISMPPKRREQSNNDW